VQDNVVDAVDVEATEVAVEEIAVAEVVVDVEMESVVVAETVNAVDVVTESVAAEAMENIVVVEMANAVDVAMESVVVAEASKVLLKVVLMKSLELKTKSREPKEQVVVVTEHVILNTDMLVKLVRKLIHTTAFPELALEREI
jgi:hypothetical protein